MINSFRGSYDFLSNFYIVDVTYNGITYRNTEAAFQGQKVLDKEERESFASLSPSAAKFKGRNCELRPDWEEVKDILMYEIVKAKFTQNSGLKKKLLATNDEELVEGNRWHDTYWGVCGGVGENKLGKILMKVREELRG